MGDGGGAPGVCAGAAAATTSSPTARSGGATATQGCPNPGKRLGAVSRPSGHCQEPETGRIAASFAGSSLLELSVAVGPAQTPCVALVDSGASHCFIAEHVARAAGVCWDVGVRLGVRLADGELRPCLGLARAVHVRFLPGV